MEFNFSLFISLLTALPLLTKAREGQKNISSSWTRGPGPNTNVLYLLPHEKLTCLEASTFCQKQGSELASVLTAEENAFMLKEVQASDLQTSDTKSLWIGLYLPKTTSTRSWTWRDNQTLEWTNWDSSVNTDPATILSCACAELQYDDGKWKPLDCSNTRRFMCKKYLNSQSVDWVPGSSSSISYHVHQLPERCDVAQLSCENIGASLASVTSQEQNDFITKMVKNNHGSHLDPESLWIGLHLSNYTATSPPTWIWRDSQPTDYTNWKPGANQVTAGGKYSCACAEIQPDDGMWNHVECASKRRFICQRGKEPPPGHSSGLHKGVIVFIVLFIMSAIILVGCLVFRKTWSRRRYRQNVPLVWEDEFETIS